MNQDLAFISYYGVVLSFIRQILVVQVFQRFAKWWGIRSLGRRERYGEQGYALVYFAIFGAWGVVCHHSSTVDAWKLMGCNAGYHAGSPHMVVQDRQILDRCA